jgi:Protein of unknown function (DUF3306)
MAKRDQNEDKARNFLSRWSQRKQAGEQEAEAPGPAPGTGIPSKESSRAGADSGVATARPDPRAATEPAERPTERGIAVEAGTDAEAGFDLKDLPDIDSLQAGSDFKVFLRAGVPDALRRRALRKLWRVHPVLGFIDGLDDYNLDYTDAATVVPNMKTLYKVGKGMIMPEDEIAEAEAQAEAAEAAARGPAVEEGEAKAPGESDAAGEGAAPDQARLADSGQPADKEEALGAPTQSPAPEPAPRKRNPGDPVVSESAAGGKAGRRAAVTRPAARSARSRRWGD